MKKRNKPHPRILAMLQGPSVPDDFISDGCTASPDAWFYWACRIHDYQAHLLRKKWKMIQNYPIRQEHWKELGSKNGQRDQKRNHENWFEHYKLAETYLHRNIEILSKFYVDDYDRIRVRKPWHPKRMSGWFIGKMYSRVTGSLFKWATTGKDHERKDAA